MLLHLSDFFTRSARHVARLWQGVIALVVLFTTSLVIGGCLSSPSSIAVVQSFDKAKYLGQWYEIARIDNRFQRGLTSSSANYSLNDDGSIRVVNRGYNAKTERFEEAIGTAKFVGDDTEGRLKVSFFWPFYGGYHLVDIDENYEYALVIGDTPDYAWILSRHRQIPESVKQRLIDKARTFGVATEQLLWDKQAH